jgi:hypothetical protein
MMGCPAHERQDAESEAWVDMKRYRPLFQLDGGGAARLRAGPFPGVLDDVDGGATPVQARGLELPPYALAELLGPFPGREDEGPESPWTLRAPQPPAPPNSLCELLIPP